MKLIEALPLFVGEFDNSNTKKTYQAVLNPFVQAIGPARPLENISNADLHAYIQDLKNTEIRWATHPVRPKIQRPYSAATIANHVRVIKRFFSWLVNIGEMQRDPSTSLKMPRQNQRVVRNKAAEPQEIELILRVAFGKPRDYALCLFLIDTGCRAGGVAGLKISNLDLANLKAVVTEKGNKTRHVWFSEAAAHALKVWLASRPHWKHDYVFGTKKGGLTSVTVSQIIRRCSVSGGGRSLGSHSLRHAKGYQLADSGVDVSTAALALGHEDPSTTLLHYYPVDLRRAEDAIRATHKASENELKILKLRSS